MHVSSKKMAFLGLLLAVAMVLTLLGGYFEPATLFFMAAAAFVQGLPSGSVVWGQAQPSFLQAFVWH